MRVDAFLTSFEENKLFEVIYYHNPSRWTNIDFSHININETEWSQEMKFLAPNGLDISDEVKRLPTDKGGIYVFFIKGIILPYFETYLAYIGRAQFTSSHNLRIRCHKYYYEFFDEDTRPKIFRMIKKWGDKLYLRYYPSNDNDLIKAVESKLIKGILPPFNDEIPDEIIYKPSEPAF